MKIQKEDHPEYVGFHIPDRLAIAIGKLVIFIFILGVIATVIITAVIWGLT